MAYDTTLTGTSAELLLTPEAGGISGDGIIAVVGRFEKGDGNTPYYIGSPRSAADVIGSNPEYPGLRVIEQLFKKDTLNNSEGANGAIIIKAGASLGASITLVDTTGTPVNVMKITLPGGLWGNSITATIADGSNNGQKLVLKNGTETWLTFDNFADTTELYQRLSNRFDLKVEALDLTKTLKNVVNQEFSGGTEVANPTNADLLAALNVLLEEDFDHIVFTDTPSDNVYPVISTYLMSRVADGKFSATTLPVSTSKTDEDKLTLINSINSGLINLIPQSYTLLGEDVLNEAESAARYAGFLVGLEPQISPTNKVISDIIAVNKLYDKPEKYTFTKAGATLIEVKNRQNRTYSVASAVTSSKEVDSSGKKTALSEQHAVQTLIYVMRILNDIKNKLGSTGFTETKDAVDGEISNRIEPLIPRVAADIKIPTRWDEENNTVLIGDVSLKAKGILKWIHYRAGVTLEGGE